jgi:RNA polymerase primary sigma factor
MSNKKSSAAVAEPANAEAPAEAAEEELDDDAAAPAPSAEGELVVLDEEFEFEEAVEAEPDEDEPRPPTAKTKSEEGGGDSMLARYFREMATHPVMGQEEELGTAVDVEKAEVEHWCAILSFLPAAEQALDALEADLPKEEEAIDVPQIAELRKHCKLYKKQKNKLTKDQ